ncbi:Signal peptidase I [hydrothermal vent metagenome]|uniref:Signal peptidase I n=1 Tax=hydrothermal vent metagenome TaxID=652676 RepID=A0A3B1B093_9ZZZZ
MSGGIAGLVQAVDEEGDVIPRKPIVALLLSICPGLGHHYAGYLGRGVFFYIALILTSWAAAAIFMFIDSRISMVFLATPFIGVAAIAFDAYRLAKQQPKTYKRRWFNRSWIYAAVFLTLALTINPLMDQIAGKHIVRAYFITSPGMQPTVLTHDLILVNKMAFPKKQDIALIEFGDEEGGQLTNLKGRQLIGRVIGVPGDIAEVNSKGVFINGKPLHEPYANFVEPTRTGAIYDANSSFGPTQVPADAYFILADNRTYGFDSRLLGFIDKEKIGGKVEKVFWSWNHDDGHFKWGRTAMSLK